MLERDLEKKCCRRVKQAGGECIKLLTPNGIPDRMILLPHGRIFFVEFKTTSGRSSRLQEWWQRRLIKLGFVSIITSDENYFEEILREHMTSLGS